LPPSSVITTLLEPSSSITARMSAGADQPAPNAPAVLVSREL
jgi:hypothetical protein